MSAIRWLGLLFTSIVLIGSFARAEEPAPRRAFVELTTLRLLREKGVLTQAEYDSSVRDLAESTGTQAGDALTLVVGRWSTTMYGFVEADHIFDSTESFNDLAGNAQVARPGTYQGDHPRLMFGVRNSRIGFRLRAPEYHRVRVSAMLEMDFLGNQPPGATEAALFTSPGFRIRHFNLKLETPIVDVLVGQYWQLFGWQSAYQPNTVEIQGLPGELYSRTVQLRVSKSIRTQAFTLELAAAMMRPPQRDSATPEGQAGVRLSFNHWTGLMTSGSTGTSLMPLSVAITADVRHFSLSEFSATPQRSVGKTGWGIAADAYLPLVRATPAHKSNALSANAEYAFGYGTADLYSGLTGGVSFAALPNPTGATPPPAYTPNVDPGLVVYSADGSAHLIQWQSAMVGVQYALPALNGRLWVAANYSHMDSKNSFLHGAAAKVRRGLDWADANLFADVTPSVRLGLEYAWFRDEYADGVAAVNHRVQLSAFYLF